jgi:hypothetical protein
MSYKVYLLDSTGKESRLFVFNGGSQTEFDSFSDIDKQIIRENNIIPQYSTQQIHKDDSIRAIKKKIIQEYGTNLVSYDEIYMFSAIKNTVQIFKTYMDMTNNDTTPLTLPMIYQLLVNLNAPPEKMKEIYAMLDQKKTASYTYDDLLRLGINNEDFETTIPIGIKFGKSHNYLFSANPFTIMSDEGSTAFRPSNKNPLLALDNSLLLNYNKTFRETERQNTIYVCLFGNVLEYAKKTGIDAEYMIQCYYPHLSDKNITTEEEFLKNQQRLIEENKSLLKTQTLTYYETIDMFYNVRNNKKTELAYSTQGIKTFEIVIHPEYKTILPLDTIFKQIHASKIMPYVKYNPGIRRENLYRLYSDKISKSGKKIPHLTKSQINNLIRVTGKTNQISFVIEHKIQGVPIDVFIDIEKNGNIVVHSENTGEFLQGSKTIAIVTVGELKNIISEILNPVINSVNDIIEQSGYKINLFRGFYEDNIEITDLTYISTVPYKHKINLKNDVTCLSTVFDIIDDDINKGAVLRYKRVDNFKKMTAMSAMITEIFKKTNNEHDVIYALMSNYGKTEEEALLIVADYFSQHIRVNAQYVNKDVDIAENPGFQTIFRLLPFEHKFMVEITNINSLEYIECIETYLDSYLRLSQAGDEVDEQYKALCRKTKEVIEDETHIENVVAAIEVRPIEASTNKAMAFFAMEEEEVEEGGIAFEDDEEEEGGIVFEEDEEEEGGIVFEEEEGGIVFDEEEDETEVEVEENKMVAGGDSPSSYEPGSKEAEELIKTWSKKNVLFKKMKTLEPTLFLTKEEGQYTSYSRACPTNINRQPIILTDEEKAKIDRDHAGSYTNAIQYGTNPDKKYWYICPRYWCLLTNTSLTEQQVKDGACGGKIIPPPRKKEDNQKIPPGHYIYEFTDNKYHKNADGTYAQNSPGFLAKDKHPTHCLPCCFKTWDSQQQKDRREECLASDTRTKPAEQDKTEKTANTYIVGVARFPVPPNRWGFLPLEIELFLHTNNELSVNKFKPNEIKLNTPSMLRYGVEQSAKNSFIGCIADIYSFKKNLDRTPTNMDMLQIIIKSMNLDMYIKYNNGSLVSVFQPPKTQIDEGILSKYYNTELYKSINPYQEEQADFFEDTVASFENFIHFLTDENSTVDHMYLWDILTTPNKNLFDGGINLIIMEIADDDVTNNVKLLCPTNSYAASFYDNRKETVLLIKREAYYEPVYLYENKGNVIIVNKTFLESRVPETLKRLFITIQKSLGKYCAVQPSIRHKFKRNIAAKDLFIKLRAQKYDIVSQIMNYRGKIVAIMCAPIDKGGKEKGEAFYIPCYPSAVLPELKIEYIDSDGLWRTYEETRDFLIKLHDDSNGEILCQPKIKVIDQNLIVGILTETNQFIQVSPPSTNIIEDGLETLEDVNYIMADKTLTLSESGDMKRIETIKNISLETQFYNAFRSTVRILLNDHIHKELRDSIIRTLDNIGVSYVTSLKTLESVIRRLTRNYVQFNTMDKDVLDSFDTISACTTNCDKKKYCLLTQGSDCKLLLPKTNLINGLDNETTYFIRIADELLRYKRIRLFMLNPKNFLNVTNTEYQINENEFIILHSLLTTTYFDDLVPFQVNSFIKNVTYDFANPRISNKYSYAVSMADQKELDGEKLAEVNEYGVECIKDTIPLVGNVTSYWRAIFPKDTKEYVLDSTKYCSYYVIIHILQKKYKTAISIENIKLSLWNAYEPFMKDYSKRIFDVLSKQGKHAMMERIKRNEVTFQDLIMSEEYYISTLDIWALASKLNIPIMLFTSTSLKDLMLDVRWLIMGGNQSDDFYFIRAPAVVKDSRDYINDYHLVTSSYKLSELVGMDGMLTSQETEYQKNVQSFSSYVQIKKTRKLRGFDETFLSMITSENTVTPGKDTTKDEFEVINNELLDKVLTYEDEEGDVSAAPMAFLDESIYEYQEKSHFINGFLRNNITFYTEHDLFYLFKLFGVYVDYDDIKWYINNNDTVNIKKTIQEYLPLEIRDKIKKISAIDYLFSHPRCPKFKGQTILYRGTDQLYNTSRTYNDPAFVSTTKTLDTLFATGEFINKEKKCCIHVLLVEPGVPYIDLEKERSSWSHQKEILLPRGLSFERIISGTYTNSDGSYKAFLYKVSLPSSQPAVYSAEDSNFINSIVSGVTANV